MIKHPLFGKDSSPAYTAPRLGVAGTIIIWLIFLICGLFIHPFKKPKFETVQIVLDTTPIESIDLEQSKNKSLSDFDAPAKTPVEEPKQSAENPQNVNAMPVQNTENLEKTEKQPESKTVKKVEKPKQNQQKTDTPKTENYTKAPAYQLKKSVDDLMAEQASERQSNTFSADFDPWAQFDENVNATSVQNTETAPKQRRIENALSGSAGNAAESKTQSATTSTDINSYTKEESVSENTTSSLEKIAASTYSTKSFDGNSESVSLVKSARNSEGKVTVAMNDGSNRALIYPSKPVVNISDENAKLIDGTKTVTISFSVVPAGSVPQTTILISPSNILPTAVQKEILEQLSEWLFEQGNNTSSAQFEFTILIK